MDRWLTRAAGVMVTIWLISTALGNIAYSPAELHAVHGLDRMYAYLIAQAGTAMAAIFFIWRGVER